MRFTKSFIVLFSARVMSSAFMNVDAHFGMEQYTSLFWGSKTSRKSVEFPSFDKSQGLRCDDDDDDDDDDDEADCCGKGGEGARSSSSVGRHEQTLRSSSCGG